MITDIDSLIADVREARVATQMLHELAQGAVLTAEDAIYEGWRILDRLALETDMPEWTWDSAHARNLNEMAQRLGYRGVVDLVEAVAERN